MITKWLVSKVYMPQFACIVSSMFSWKLKQMHMGYLNTTLWFTTRISFCDWVSTTVWLMPVSTTHSRPLTEFIYAIRFFLDLFSIIFPHCYSLFICVHGVDLLCNSMHGAALSLMLLNNVKRPIRAGLRERRSWTKGVIDTVWAYWLSVSLFFQSSPLSPPAMRLL